jgi:hypothetical protein
VVAALVALAGGAQAAEGARPTAIVSMGDSYISGEAGRWQGNSNTAVLSRDGTDRACVPSMQLCTSYDPAQVYVDGSDANGCHRSDVAEIVSAPVAVGRKVNLACSGAVTRNIFRSSNGGEAQKGEPPQADKLAAAARDNRVQLVVLSIGGNDLGFGSIVQACVVAYASKQPPCETTEQAKIDAAMPAAMAGVANAIDEIRAVLRAAGYAGSQYRIVLQSYPSAIPRAAENRYLELSPERAAVGGCPFYDSDSDWARDGVVSQISDNLKAVAAAKGVQFMDLRDMLQGREICSVHASLATPLAPASPTRSEWARFLQAGSVVQGELQEVFHPNAYAQRALGTCLSLVYARSSGHYSCTNRLGGDTSAMSLTQVP